ncbi:hypothetical protein EV191_1011296 [Tamaricihabitans halophyticus]|uniref:YCII-related domain-containing protein n=1 Tax=Tamaricihabitans halophyticus TaxID=1262583 RepID=A0A4R2RC85_9PSEU|nr:YciI family protein [Tamaricihabitans halophyticus]TCP57341.1 hypothetical protein EV191_1011296 [Tamaricihabitans halophyticus]
MANYVGFLRGGDAAYAKISPTEAQRALERYLAWDAELAAAGNPVGGGGLSRSAGRVLGTRVSGSAGAITDGPYTEGSEVVGGVLTIEAADLDEAEKIFSTHPHLDFGIIEVRKLGEQGCED